MYNVTVLYRTFTWQTGDDNDEFIHLVINCTCVVILKEKMWDRFRILNLILFSTVPQRMGKSSRSWIVCKTNVKFTISSEWYFWEHGLFAFTWLNQPLFLSKKIASDLTTHVVVTRMNDNDLMVIQQLQIDLRDGSRSHIQTMQWLIPKGNGATPLQYFN